MKSGIGGEWENSGLVNLVQERTLGTRLRSCERIYEVWARVPRKMVNFNPGLRQILSKVFLSENM